jgi:VanZ family protein
LTAPAPTPPSARSPIATLLLLGWTLLIVYASWFPLIGWRWPAGLDVFGWLQLPWPRGHSTFDIVANALGYMPLGLLLVLALARPHDARWRAVGEATLTAALLSYAMEVGQHLLPQRVPSLLDWLLNTGGAVCGSVLGVVLQRTRTLAWLHDTGHTWFAQRSRSGLALLAMWPIALLFPTPVALGLGQVGERLREALRRVLLEADATEPLLRWLDAAPAPAARLSPVAEMLAVALGLLGPCLMTYSMARPGPRRIWLALGATALGFGITTLSTALNFGPQHALAWCTASSVAGLALGGALALLSIGTGRRSAAGLGLVVMTAGVALVAQAPSDPYFAASLHGWEQGRFIRFHGLAQWVGWWWPYLATLWLLRQVAARE